MPTASPPIDVVVDAMGGDHAPDHPVAAAIAVAREDDLKIGLVGDQAAIQRALEKHGGTQLPGLSIHHASETIGMDEKPSAAVRKKKDNSISVAARLLRDGQGRAMVSAGNSGAVMAAGLLVIGRIPGVQRPPLASKWPTAKEPVVFVDLGANIDPTGTQLAQFGVMGDAYAKAVLGRARPKVALLANGSEESKGSDLTREAHEILTKCELDFVGYCEGTDLFKGELDVIVTDGFTGNVLLKTLEGFLDAMGSALRAEIEASFLAKTGAMLMQGFLRALKRKLDYESVGAAPLLGLEHPLLIAHGRSTTKALMHAIRNAKAEADQPVAELTRAAIEHHAELGLWPLRAATSEE